MPTSSLWDPRRFLRTRLTTPTDSSVHVVLKQILQCYVPEINGKWYGAFQNGAFQNSGFDVAS